jgi:hypothetical protein
MLIGLSLGQEGNGIIQRPKSFSTRMDSGSTMVQTLSPKLLLNHTIMLTAPPKKTYTGIGHGKNFWLSTALLEYRVVLRRLIM